MLVNAIENNIKIEAEFTETESTRRFMFVYKIKNDYVHAIKNKLENIYYILHRSKSLKSLDTSIDYESKLIIKIYLDNALYNQKHNSTILKCPVNRQFNIGDSVIYGFNKHGIVIDKNDYFYYVKFDDRYDVIHWHDLFPINYKQTCNFNLKKQMIYYHNTTLTDLYCKFFDFGIDLNPDYQRGNVWTYEQKVKLIDSIFNQINIGQFVFVEKKWYDKNDVVDDMYEILDGKQRLTAIIDFISGNFKYNGYFYHELSPDIRNKFDNFGITIGEFRLGGDKYDKKSVIENFIRLNECGTSMDKSVIDNAKKLIENE